MNVSPSKAAFAAIAILAPLTITLTLCVAPGCDDAPTHIYSAQLYEQANDCLDDYTALDIVTGGTGSSGCNPVCLVGGGATYVSTVCPPYATAVAPGAPDDPACIAALAAYQTCKWCMSTGNEPTCTYDGGDAGMVDDAGDQADSGGSDASDASDGGDGTADAITSDDAGDDGAMADADDAATDD